MRRSDANAILDSEGTVLILSKDSWSIETLLPGSRMQAAVTLLRKDEMFVLVDTGWPRTRAQLVSALSTLGTQPHQITHVLHTHLHVDHAANHPIFSEAVLLASKLEFQWADRLYRDLVHDEDDARFIRSVFPDIGTSALNLAQA